MKSRWQNPGYELRFCLSNEKAYIVINFHCHHHPIILILIFSEAPIWWKDMFKTTVSSLKYSILNWIMKWKKLSVKADCLQ